jgi:putative FmdB family regulatory protein
MMPTYEYRCARCAYQFESIHAVGETVDRCERCGGPVRRVFSPPALIFKGSGFHVTDYRKTPAPSDGDGKAAGDAKGAGSAKTTPETKKSDSGSTTTSSTSEGKKAS